MTTIAPQELFSLAGRVALVTGASGGIGSALARGLALAGAAVALSGRSDERLATVLGEIDGANGVAAAFPSDLSAEEAPALLARQVRERMGRIDILVNCAGMNRRMPIASVTPAVYDTIMDTNLRSAFFLAQAIAPMMAANGGGKIINIGSLTTTVGLNDVSVYGMTKSALGQLTKTMAIEWAPQNIQVNCLCPGFIATDLTEVLWNDPGRRRWMLDRIPAGRAGAPDDLVGLAIFLASAASNYVTGQAIYVDGGFLAGSAW